MDISSLLNPIYQENPAKCPTCDKIFSNRHARERHEATVHVSALLCPYCNRKVKYRGRPDLLKQHLIRCTKYVPTVTDAALWEKEVRELYNTIMSKK